MEFRYVTREPVEVVLLSGRVVVVEAGEPFEVTGDDAKALESHALFTRIDEPKPRQRHDPDPEPEPQAEPAPENPPEVAPVGQTVGVAVGSATEKREG